MEPKGESVLRASPPEREEHPAHLRTVADAVLREVVLHLPNSGVWITIHPTQRCVHHKSFFHNPNIASSLCSLHIIQNISTWAAITVAPPSCFFLVLYVYIYVWLYVCACVHYLEKNIKSKKSVIVIIEFTPDTVRATIDTHIYEKYWDDTMLPLSPLY